MIVFKFKVSYFKKIIIIKMKIRNIFSKFRTPLDGLSPSVKSMKRIRIPTKPTNSSFKKVACIIGFRFFFFFFNILSSKTQTNAKYNHWNWNYSYCRLLFYRINK